MLLATGKQIHAYVCKELPINEKVIQGVDDTATKEKSRNDQGVPNFEWTPGIPITDQAENEHTPVKNNPTAVIPRTTSQDMRKRKDTLKKKNITKRKKNMTTHQIFIANQQNEIVTNHKFNEQEGITARNDVTSENIEKLSR